MKSTTLIIAAAASMLALAGCTSMSQKEDLQTRAAATCMDRATEAERKTCMDTEIAAMTAMDRKDQRAYSEAQAEREQREAIRQAYGVPKSAARETYDNGLGLPGGRSQ